MQFKDDITRIVKFVVARQMYKTDASQEYVIVGNDAMIKCQYPSFVSDFLEVQGWKDSEGIFYPSDSGAKIDHGNSCSRPCHCIGLLVVFIGLAFNLLLFDLILMFLLNFQLHIRNTELWFMKNQWLLAMMSNSNAIFKVM